MRFAGCTLRVGLLRRDRNLRCLENAPRQLLKVLARLLLFVVFVFHIPYYLAQKTAPEMYWIQFGLRR
jgi:hypothetical protein